MRRPALLLAAAVLSLAAGACSSGGSSSDAGPGSAGPSSSGSSTSGSPSPSAEAVTATPPTPPAVGACYRLSYDAALAPTNEDAAVPCGRPHTSQTYAVGRLDTVANGHLLGVDSNAVRHQVQKRCPARLPAFLGATPEQLRLSLIRTTWFTPSLEESDAGADWYRCDAIAVTGDRTLASFGTDLAKALATPAGRAEFAMCGTAQPGSAAFAHVLCRDDHTWKAISVVDLADESEKGGYPGTDAVKAAGQDPCAAAARAIASDPLDYEWGYEWPTQRQWNAGQTYGRCWSPDPA